MNPLPEHGRRVAIYARVSTSDRDQNVETQLMPLREFAQAQGWEVYEEYLDRASATDLAHRAEWKRLLDDASKRRFDLLLVWRKLISYANSENRLLAGLDWASWKATLCFVSTLPINRIGLRSSRWIDDSLIPKPPNVWGTLSGDHRPG